MLDSLRLTPLTGAYPLARPHVRRAAGFFVLLWFFYIGMSVAYTYGMF